MNINLLKIINLNFKYDNRFYLLRINNLSLKEKIIFFKTDIFPSDNILFELILKQYKSKNNIFINDVDINNLNYKKDLKISYSTNIFLSGNVKKNLEYPLKVYKISKKNRDINFLHNVCNNFNVNIDIFKNIKNLSLKEKQIVSLLRAFISAPNLLIIKLFFVDKDILNLISLFHKKNENTMILISYGEDISFDGLDVCKYILENGSIQLQN